MPQSKTLDAAALEALGRPFTWAAVKVKPQTKPGTDKKSLATYYVDARLVAERLNHVVGPEGWEDSYKPLLASAVEMASNFFPVECTLRVLGVTKTDVGVYQRASPDDKAWKSSYSDSLKRAAVKFRVGAYLYAIPNLRAEVTVGHDGKAKGFSDTGLNFLERAYLRWLDNPELNRFGEQLDHGDIVLSEGFAAGDETIEFPESRVA